MIARHYILLPFDLFITETESRKTESGRRWK